jgi:flagella basal body P-ring formation protein FlgA
MKRLVVILVALIALAPVHRAGAETTVEVPVLARALGLGDVIAESDIAWVTLPFAKVPRNAITDASDLVGMSPKRLVKPGAPVRDGDVAPPIVVPRNATVVLVFATANLTLTAKGKALENGAVGDRVRVENLQSEIVVEGLVQADGTVAVGLF